MSSNHERNDNTRKVHQATNSIMIPPPILTYCLISISQWKVQVFDYIKGEKSAIYSNINIKHTLQHSVFESYLNCKPYKVDPTRRISTLPQHRKARQEMYTLRTPAKQN